MIFKKKSMLVKMMVPLVSVLVLGSLFLVFFIARSTEQNMQKAIVIDSKDTVNQFKVLRKYYAENVIKKVKNAGTVEITVDHKGNDTAIPLPATMIHDLSELLRGDGKKEIKLYSAFPFPNRKGRTLDTFEKESLAYFKTNPDEVFVRTEAYEGQEVVRVAIADKMVSPVCVNCHNAHPDSPKTDWKLNEVRGVLEVITPVALQAKNNKLLNFKIMAAQFLMLVIMVAFLTVIFKRVILKPIDGIVEMVKDIAEGEGDLTKRLHVEADDEMGEMAKWFNLFLDRIHNVVSKVVSSTQSVASSSEQLSSVSAEIAQGTEEQARQSETVATAMSEMSATVTEVARNSQSAAELAKDAQSTATKGGEIVLAAVKGIEDLTNIVERTSGEVKELGGNSEQIGEIVATIDDIADQTNLLALNAAIEAARAGEQGRGFAVVADEVRQLAERTTKATAEVRKKIGTVQEETSKVVKSMEEGAKKSVEGIELVRSAGSVLEEIVQGVDKVSEMIQHIATAAEEQSTASEEISTNVEGMAQVTSETADKVMGNAEAIQELNKTAEELKGLVEGFKV